MEIKKSLFISGDRIEYPCQSCGSIFIVSAVKCPHCGFNNSKFLMMFDIEKLQKDIENRKKTKST